MPGTEPTGRPHRNHGLFSEARRLRSPGHRRLRRGGTQAPPEGRGRLTPASLRALRSGYEEGAVPIRDARAEAARLERRLSDLVNEAYGLSPEEVELLWSTAPPRIPRF